MVTGLSIKLKAGMKSGRASLEQEKINGKKIRDQYIAALKEADKRKIESLVKFARS